MKTYSAKPKEAEAARKWILVDAEDVVLGRLAAEVATVLRGKHKPMFTPHIDTGDHVIVVNAEKVALTGNKRAAKRYYRHSGYPGGLKEKTAEQVLSGRFPERVIEKAVQRMVPRGPLGRDQLRKLHVYAGPEHPHQGQRPEPLDIASMNVKNRSPRGDHG
jgi:large subunit ribosomal protein L13